MRADQLTDRVLALFDRELTRLETSPTVKHHELEQLIKMLPALSKVVEQQLAPLSQQNLKRLKNLSDDELEALIERERANQAS